MSAELVHCVHLRAAVIATDARIFAIDGAEARGDIRWCLTCGASLPLSKDIRGAWMRPGSDLSERAFRAMQERDANAAAQGGRARNG
jgi:hypothetical protein